MDSFWRQIKQDAQYQQEYVIDWAVYLEYLQAVLKMFDSIAIPNEEVLIQCLRESLWPSI